MEPLEDLNVIRDWSRFQPSSVGYRPPAELPDYAEFQVRNPTELRVRYSFAHVILPSGVHAYVLQELETRRAIAELHGFNFLRYRTS